MGEQVILCGIVTTRPHTHGRASASGDIRQVHLIRFGTRDNAEIVTMIPLQLMTVNDRHALRRKIFKP